MMRGAFQDGFKRVDGFTVFSFKVICKTQVVLGIKKFWIQTNGFFIMKDGVIQKLLFKQLCAKGIVCLDKRWGGILIPKPTCLNSALCHR